MRGFLFPNQPLLLQAQEMDEGRNHSHQSNQYSQTQTNPDSNEHANLNIRNCPVSEKHNNNYKQHKK
jgi:hypothetical protein